ncbi:MAG: peptide ABC transporter substrate-binding protein [Negativicutes bacterium]
MSRKLANATENIVWIGLMIIIIAIIGAALMYFQPWKLLLVEEHKVKLEQRDVNSITIAGKFEPAGLNPYTSSYYSTVLLAKLLYSGLVEFDEKSNPEADLVEIVPSSDNGGVSADGKTVTYKLRKDVLWSDGQPFGAKDVIETWKYIMSSKKVNRRVGYDQITTIDLVDDNTVAVHFKQYYPEYLTLFPVILPAHLLTGNPEKIEREPVGTGPYMLKEWMLGDCLMLAANDNYFKGKPKIGIAKVKFIGETKLLLAQLKAGKLDIAPDIDLQQLGLLKTFKDYSLVLQPTLELERLDFNTDSPLFKDEKIRCAIALAVDKKYICKNLLNDAVILSANYVAPFSELYNAEVVDKYDVQAAKTLLADNGWSPGIDGVLTKAGVRLSFGLSVNAKDINRMVIAENIASGLREIGIEAVIVKVPDETFAKTITAGNFQMTLYTIMMYPDFGGDMLWSSTQVPTAANGYSGRNFSRFKDPRIDKLFQEIAGSQSIAGRKTNVLQVQKYLSEAMPSIPLFYYQSVNMVRKELKNFKPGAVFASEYRNAYLWQW